MIKKTSFYSIYPLTSPLLLLLLLLYCCYSDELEEIRFDSLYKVF